MTRERLPYFIPFFLMSSRLPNLTTLGGVPLSLGVYARCQGLIVSSSTCLWLRRVTSIATVMFSRIWSSGPFRVTTRLYVWLFKNRLFGGQQGKRIPSWMSKHPTVKHRQPFGAPSAPRSSWQPVGQPDALTWELLDLELVADASVASQAGRRCLTAALEALILCNKLRNLCVLSLPNL